MRTTLSLLAVVSLLALPCVAEARKPAKRSPADAKLDAAVAMVDAKAWDKAATELDRVYAANRDPRALYWLGRALQGGGKHAAAMRAYQRYVKEAAPSADQARMTDALGNVQLLSMQVGTITVTAPEGCAITVDG
ncbi:MAG TPA: tetratricopeptide repeat protein, partial [Labilithrix sp.]